MITMFYTQIHTVLPSVFIACEEPFCEDRAAFKFERQCSFPNKSLTELSFTFLCSKHLASHVRNAATVFVDRYLVGKTTSPIGGSGS